MKQETEQVLQECVAKLGSLLENENAQVVREGTILLKTFDSMLMISNEWSRVYAGVLERARVEEETFSGEDPGVSSSLAQSTPLSLNVLPSPNARPQPIEKTLCNCGLSTKMESVKESPFFGKKICDMTCKDSEQKAKGDVTEYIKFLSEESDENQTESDLNEAVEDISNFVDDQLGIVKPNQVGAARSGEKDIADGKKKFLDKQEKPKSKAKITTVENIEELIKERTNDREAALANERKKIKEEQGQIYTEERKNTKIEVSLSPNATPRVTKAELNVK